MSNNKDHLVGQLTRKRVTRVHSAQSAHRSFWVMCKKCTLHFGPLKNACNATKILVVLPLGIFRIDSFMAPQRSLFCQKSVVTSRRVGIHWAGWYEVAIFCNSLRRGTPTGPKGQKVTSEPFGPRCINIYVCYSPPYQYEMLCF